MEQPSSLFDVIRESVDKRIAAKPKIAVVRVRPDQWPFWAKQLRKLAKPQDKGLGDVIERIVGPFGGTAFQNWYKQTFGTECPQCQNRKEDWNTNYPLEVK